LPLLVIIVATVDPSTLEEEDVEMSGTGDHINNNPLPPIELGTPVEASSHHSMMEQDDFNPLPIEQGIPLESSSQEVSFLSTGPKLNPQQSEHDDNNGSRSHEYDHHDAPIPPRQQDAEDNHPFIIKLPLHKEKETREKLAEIMSDSMVPPPTRRSRNVGVSTRRTTARPVVIAIDGIRAVAPPENATGPSLNETVGTLGLPVGSDLLFSLDKNDPIFQQAQETVNQQQQNKPESSAQNVDTTTTASTSPTSTALSLENEQAIRIARLNAVIMSAEGEEEVMYDLDQEILEAELKDLLERVLEDIEQAEQEYLEQSKSGSSVHCISTFDDTMSMPDEEWEEYESVLLPSSQAVDKVKGNQNIVQDVEMIQLQQVTKLIPKRLYADGEDPVITPEIFQRDILKQVRQKLVSRHPLLAWSLDARLEENLDDDDSFLLKARGPKEALNCLKKRTEEVVQLKIAAHNLRLLLCDGASVEVNIQMNRQGKLGARVCRVDNKAGEGVWVSHVPPDQELGKVLGPDATKGGSAIVGLDGKRVRNHSEFTQLLKKAKETDGTMAITLCMNKYADLSKIDQSRLVDASKSPRRRDGLPYFKPCVTLPVTPKVAPKPKSSRPVAAAAETETKPLRIPLARLPPRPTTVGGQRLAFCKVLAHEANVEIDLEITTKESLGISVIRHDNSNDSEPKGLWIFEFKSGGQLERILGTPACTVGAAVLSVNGVACEHAGEIKILSENAAQFDGNFRVTLCFFNGTDFSAMDQSRLVQGRVNPRRRNGEPYPVSGAVPLPASIPGQRRSVAPSARGTEVSARAKTAASGNRGSGTEKTKATTTGGKKRTAVEESRERTLKIARTKERATEKTVASTATKVESYHNFKNKIKTASEIEFQGTAIRMIRVFSLMWTRHKKLFGEVNSTCDETCQCIFRLPELTENVVEDFIADEKEKNSDWKPDGDMTTTGFVGRFFRRFLPLIRSEYPKENAQDCLERLVGMWRLHQKNQNFGLMCKETCDCAEGWELVFHKGDLNKSGKLPKKANSVMAVKKQKLNSGSSNTTSSEAGLMNMALPRKQKAKTTSLLKPYEVKFNPKSPLGAYFVTERSSTGTSKCKVHSVWQKGQAKSDPRVHPGELQQRAMLRLRKTVGVLTSFFCLLLQELSCSPFYSITKLSLSKVIEISNDITRTRNCLEQVCVLNLSTQMSLQFLSWRLVSKKIGQMSAPG
jgi:hypothetical protein